MLKRDMNACFCEDWFLVLDQDTIDVEPLPHIATPDQLNDNDVDDLSELTCKYAHVTSLDPVLINVTPHVIDAVNVIQEVRRLWSSPRN